MELIKSEPLMILATVSPRRRELAGLLPFRFEFRSPSCEEILNPALAPHENAIALADAKAKSVGEGGCIIGCDTIVTLDNRILGKPRNRAHAGEMLCALSGRVHKVITGVSIRTPECASTFCEETLVSFRELEEAEIRSYIETGEPMDKAGAYGIQGHAAHFVQRIEGDYFNVVGLPLCRLVQELRNLGF